MITVEEKHRGISGDAFNRTKEYVVIGTDADAEMDEDAAIREVVSFTPDEYFGLARQNAQINDFILTPSQTIAIISMQWGEVDGSGGGGIVPLPTIEAAYEFAYQAPSAHIFHALDTRTYGTNAPDFGDKINVTPDGEHLGLDLPAGNTTNNWRVTVPNGYVTSAYEAMVEGMMGKTNAQEFKGRPAGTMRFVQVQSSVVAGGSMSISWGFQYSPNRTGLTISGISSVDIGGHELWWTLDKKELDLTNGKIVIKPRAVYVHQVVESADFNALGF